MRRHVRLAASTLLFTVGLLGTVAAQDARLLVRPPDGCVVPAPPRLGIVGHMEYGHGLCVERVFFGSPASRAGLEPGDVILRVNGFRLRGDDDLARALRHSGGYIRLQVEDVRTGGRVWTDRVALNNGRGPSGIHMRREQVAGFDRNGGNTFGAERDDLESDQLY